MYPIISLENEDSYAEESLEKEENNEEMFVDERTARKIMQGNFLGIKESIIHLDVIDLYDIDGKNQVIPFSKETLREHRNYILFFAGSYNCKGQPININYLTETFPELFDKNKWYLKESFAKKPIRTGWYLMKKNWLSYNKKGSYFQLKESLNNKQHYYIEETVVYVYAMILVLKAREQKLFENSYIWTRDIAKNRQVYVGWNKHIFISSWWEQFHPNQTTTIAPIKKPTF